MSVQVWQLIATGVIGVLVAELRFTLHSLAKRQQDHGERLSALEGRCGIKQVLERRKKYDV